jgi:two-component system CheB/CheR fusion protein
VRLSLEVEDGMARLDVEDDGAGIDPTFIDHLFEMFRQPGIRANRPYGGLGIGLALVKQLANLQGGRVTAKSDGIGHGARFSVWLPRSITPPQRAGSAQREGVLRGLRVLLVDDMVDTLESFAMLLRLEGAQVRSCSSAAQALHEAQQADFDLLLSDVDMPGIDGYEFLTRLRRVPRNRHVRAIALTGYAQLEDKRRAAEAGFDAHLSKPVSVQELTDTIGRLFQPR